MDTFYLHTVPYLGVCWIIGFLISGKASMFRRITAGNLAAIVGIWVGMAVEKLTGVLL
jgi:hypothetical protein